MDNQRNCALIFDGHNDVLTQLLQSGQGREAAELFMVNTDFHIDMPKAALGNWGGGLFALWAPSPDQGHEPQSGFEATDYQAMMRQAQYDIPLPSLMDRHQALDIVLEQIAILYELQRLGALSICTSIEQIDQCLGSEKLAAVMHLEGCDAIDADLLTLDVLYAAGLRSLGLVWSRPTIFGHGVPFRYPSSPDTGAGLTDAGIALVKRCNAMGIMLDVSHLNEAGFYDVARHSSRPLVATHSNAHALCPHARNLTDAQLDIIRDSGGMVGLNFACAFLRADGRMLADVAVEQMIRHIDYLLERLGENGVGLGSDFDGAEVPDAIASSAGIPVLIRAMRQQGYDDALIRRLCHDNWLDTLSRAWQPA